MNEAADNKPTPEFADCGIRMVSGLVDALCTLPLYGLLFLAMPDVDMLWRDGVFLLLVSVGFCYAFVSKWQATPGMWLMKFRATDVQGQRMSLGRAVWWCITSIGVLAVTGAGLLYLQINYDIEALTAILQQVQATQQATGQIDFQLIDEFEAKAGISFGTFYAMMIGALLFWILSLTACMFSILFGRDKAGVHNLICGVRFVKGRACCTAA